MASEETKERIIETAIELYNSRGCRSVTVDDIANSIHISKRTLYEIFESRDELVLACLTRVHQTIYNLRQEMFDRSKDPLLMMLHIIRSTTDANLRYTRLLTDARRYYPKLNAQLVKSYSTRFKASLHSLLDEAIERSDLRKSVDVDVAVDIMAFNIMKGIHYVIDDDAKDDLRNKLNESCFTYLRGLLSIKAIERYDRNEEKFRKIMESCDQNNDI